MAEKLTLEHYCQALGLSHSQMAEAVEKLTGVRMTRTLITDACHYKASERPPMALPKAQALAKFISQEMGRPISISDLGLNVI